MPWTNEDYPVAFKGFDQDKREAAITAGNAALEAGKSEADAIKDAIAHVDAEEQIELDPADRVLPHNNGWAVLNKKGTKVLSVYGFYHVAERKLKEFDKAGVS
ncbi:MAG: hypothetical protein KDB07_09585 [Planctomycetes bacterium]|nr:hypothetical protein [Planctomycetota bacterium]